MATIQQELRNYIEHGELQNFFRTLDSDAVSFGEMNNQMLQEQYFHSTQILLASFRDNSFEALSYVKKIEIRDNMRMAQESRSSITTILDYVDRFNYSVISSNLESTVFEKVNVKKEISRLNDLHQRFLELDSKLSNIDQIRKYVEEARSELLGFNQEIVKSREELSLQKTESDRLLQAFEKSHSHINEVLDGVKEVEKEIENKKLGISTFGTNIDEYKVSIENLENQARAIVQLETKIKKLIDQAEVALQLNSAQGISGAFANQYTLATNKYTLHGWTTGAAIFIITSIWLTITLISQTRIKDSTVELNPLLLNYPWIILLGRAVAVSICLSASAFCARQYTKQKNLAEDYAYKSVLSKSIVAFTKEIRKVDEEKATEYLTTVLDEIHKDPSRTKLHKSDSLSMIDIDSLVKRFTDVLSKQKVNSDI